MVTQKLFLIKFSKTFILIWSIFLKEHFALNTLKKNLG